MYDLDRAQSLKSEKAILVRVLLPESPEGADEPLDEIEGLATTAGCEVVSGLVQRRERPDAKTFLGSGKTEELKTLAQHHEADVVVFDNDLQPAQARNLEKALGVKVLDRTEVILDIFASSARTHEARLAVELAQLEYSLPRLKRMWTHLSRVKMGVGMRGPGEKQLEVDRRLVEKRIHDLKTQLHDIERRKERQVASRRGYLAVSLVGYTNAGKSTLMNALTDASVEARDKLFATLDTRTRRWRLPSWGPVLLSDTVGFIRDLPHRLIASFKATLEETRQADLLLHVADCSSPAAADQIAAVYSVLEELGVEAKDALLVLNKTDRVPDPSILNALRERYPNAIAVSARTGAGMDDLAAAVSGALSRSFVELDVEMHVGDGKSMAYLAKHGEVLSRHFEGETARIHCRLPFKHVGRLQADGVRIRPRAGVGPDIGQEQATDASQFEPAVEDVA